MPNNNHNYYIYMMTNKTHRSLYTGVTNNLERRVFEHKQMTADGYTKKYRCTKLVYFEHGSDINGAITREKQIKGWLRTKKDDLIATINPEWKDLSSSWHHNN